MTPEQKQEWEELVGDCREGRWWINCGGAGRKDAILATEARLREYELYSRLLGDAIVGFACYLTGHDEITIRELFNKWQSSK